MTEFKQARRENVPLLIGIAGPSGSGKTLSALKLAKGLSGGQPFVALDTERGRMLHYADEFDFLHADLEAPFSPERYGEALEAAVAQKSPVVVVDSFSHEHAGEGGVLDMHEAELTRLAGDDYKRREAMKFAAWIRPKAAHKRLVSELLQLPVHLIVCLRAEEKIDLVKEDGKLVVKPKRTLSGHVGWIPICGKDLPYELTISLVVTPDAPGVPQPIKLQDQHRPFVPLDRPLDENVGAGLAEWARGSKTAAPDGSPTATDVASTREEDIAALNALVGQLREGNAITTRQVWVSVARMRRLPVEDMIALLSGEYDGDVHWSPLRDSLEPDEARALRSRLGKLWAEQREGAAA